MHTSSLSGTITAAIYSNIFPWGILEHKQRHFECVCVPSMRGNQICSLQSDRDWIELAVCCCGCHWRPIVNTWGYKTKKNNTHFHIVTHTLQTWPFSQFALKLYLEVIASSISSPVIPSHHFIPGKRVLYLSIHFFLPYNNLRGALRVVRCDLVFFFPQAGVSFLSAKPHPLTVQQLQWYALLPLFLSVQKASSKV